MYHAVSSIEWRILLNSNSCVTYQLQNDRSEPQNHCFMDVTNFPVDPPTWRFLLDGQELQDYKMQLDNDCTLQLYGLAMRYID